MKMLNVSTETVQTMDTQFGKVGCTKAAICEKYGNQFMTRMVGKYVGRDGPFRGQLASAVIPLGDFAYDDYMARVKQVHKGAAIRQSKKSDRAGFVCKPFEWSNHIPDIVDINTSMDTRSGGDMKPAYLRTVEEMGGPPTKLKPVSPAKCPVHCTTCWGVFEPVPGHTQGEVVTDERLLAYIKLKRQGSLAIYTSILGHGDYLGQGIMYRLHYAIMQSIGEQLEQTMKGLEYVLYGAVDSGAGGLQMWKKRCLFESAYLVLAPDAGLPPGH